MDEGSGALPEPQKQPETPPEKRSETPSGTPPEKQSEKQPETPPGKPEMRIGHAERAAALSALDEHFEAGRLDVTEFGDRSAVAGSAVVASELTGLFRDLPAPHPDVPGLAAPLAKPAPGTPEAWAVARRPEAPLERSWGDTLATALPVLLVAAMVVMVVVFQTPGAFALFPFVFILAHRFGPHRRR